MRGWFLSSRRRFGRGFSSSSYLAHIFCSILCGGRGGIKQKPATVASRGFLLNLRSTSANGVGYYDDYQYDL
jgi:hypothetical protein